MKNVEKILNSVCLDEKIEGGIFNMENNDHMDVLQRHLVKRGISESDSVVYRNRMVEGKYPERQAYNANGILVTFPTPEYKQRAIARGTHFEENPKKGQTNVFQSQPATTPPAQTTTQTQSTPPEQPVQPAPQPTPTPDVKLEPSTTLSPQSTSDAKPLEPNSEETDADNRTPAEKSVDAKAIHQILASAPSSIDIALKYPNTESVSYTLKEAIDNNFNEKEGIWYTSEGKYVGKKWVCEAINKILIIP